MFQGILIVSAYKYVMYINITKSYEINNAILKIF